MIGDRVKKMRIAKGWKQDELGERVGLKKATISLIENNRRGRGERSVSKFAEVFDCTSDYLLGFSDDPRLDTHQHTKLKKEFDSLYKRLKEKTPQEQEMYLRMMRAALGEGEIPK
ncbi:helix-turn-helix domain-containing protein [Bacillus thuringiensis]|uniref:helix-turn-helix domain-containing protein n=1 Tax=Bacillus thuringiensis TaxID=1428 RepID=UPI001FACB462|nr:helix-turn-helix transcriptional regulator [Bacillus thuringiensis]MDM8365001.1 helix-turn-helix transcriptional regulator [Bacillus thuringiensis]